MIPMKIVLLRLGGGTLLAAAVAGGIVLWQATTAAEPIPGAERPSTADAGASSPSVATKEHPFINSLGMKFVPVPGTKALFCIWDVRVKDYAAYAATRSGVDGQWKNPFPSFKQTENDPVVVNWQDAKTFCEWLSGKEGRIYRLPTDHEMELRRWNRKPGEPEGETEGQGRSDLKSLSLGPKLAAAKDRGKL